MVRISGPANERIQAVACNAGRLSALGIQTCNAEPIGLFIYLGLGLGRGNITHYLTVSKVGVVLKIEAVVAGTSLHLVDEVYASFILVDGDILKLPLY